MCRSASASQGPNLAIVTACTTGLHCIGEAGRLIEYGDADVMVAGGAEATVSPLGIGGFAAARALSTRNDDPQDRLASLGQGSRRLRARRGRRRDGARGVRARQAPRRQDLRRTGRLRHGRRRVPHDRAQRRRPQARDEGGAAQRRHQRRSQVQYLNAHGTSHAAGRRRTRPTRSSWPSATTRSKLVVNSTKSMTGHLLGRRRRHRIGVHRAGAAPPGLAADDQHLQPGSRVRPGLLRQRGARR